VDESDAPQGCRRTSGDRTSQIIAFLTTVPGIITAIAALITAIGGAFLGGRQAASTAPQPTVTTTVIETPGPLTSSTGSGLSGSAGSDTSSKPVQSQGGQASTPIGTTGLWALTPLQDFTQSTTGSEQIGTKTYANSVRFSCAYSMDDIIYNVAGYSVLKAYIGVPNNSADAAGTTATISFLKDGTSRQLIPNVTVALDQPERVQVNLRGTSQLEIDCTASQPGGIDIVLGNATLGSS
jgi:hypothetical protein